MQAMQRFEICTQESVRKTMLEVWRMSSYIYTINTNGHMLPTFNFIACLPATKTDPTSSCDERLQRPFFEVDKMVGEEGEQLDNKAADIDITQAK